MTKLPLRSLLSALFLLSGLSLHGQAVTAVSVRGIKRTRPHVAEYPLQRFIGQDGMVLDFNEVHAAIAGTGILEPLFIGVEPAPDREGLILVVDVREKWSLFPLPVFFADSAGNMQGGAAFMDANAFGLNDTFIVAGLYGSSGWLASLIYQYTPERRRMPGWSVMGVYGRLNRLDTDQHEKELRNYDQETIMGSLGLRYPATEYLTLSLSSSLHRRNVSDGEHPREVPDRDVLAGELNPSLEISRSYWDGLLQAQRRASLGYALMLLPDQPPLHSLSVRANYEWSLVPGFKAGLRGGIHYAPDELPSFESSASVVDIAILPNSFSAQNFAGASLGLEKYLFKFSQGTLAFLLSYQAVYSHGPILGDKFDHGVSGSVNFYLSRIAIPALGFGLSYNVARGKYTGVFGAGMSF